jgi:hypothetical protein
MTSFERRLEKMEKRYSPAPLSASDWKLLNQIEEGVRRCHEDRELHGLGPIDDEDDLPAPKIHTSRGLQLTIDILQEGRELNRLRWLKINKISGSEPLLAGGA